ncbi:hypothetical protein psal_cds_705 [Pandoravirus salinus]|uniref:Uncharacterized protein n=1 Tax=Pandoravirus salinus TaxID=1349410 RepID=S4W349_9VIRU|nr:hypothetical protein psal_cds_705 [Pandoravirus salinus]AGO84665.1 hypothetical protein psal_cds_705 [Pandoravirus salinus]
MTLRVGCRLPLAQSLAGKRKQKMPALLDPATDARLQRAMAAFVLPHYLVGSDAQVSALLGLAGWLRGLPVGPVVDPVYIPIFRRLGVPLGAMYNPALLARVKALYMPFWMTLAKTLVQAPDVRVGLDWPPTPANLYAATTRYIEDQGVPAPTAPRHRDDGDDLDHAASLAQAGIARLAQVIDDVRSKRTAPVFGPLARTSAQDRGLCDPLSPSPSYLMVVSLGRDGRGVALLTGAPVGTHSGRVLASLDVAADGSYSFNAGSNGRGPYPRALGGNAMVMASMLMPAVEAVRSGRPWQMGMRRMTTFDLPDEIAAALLEARLPPPYYGVYFDECDAAPLLSIAQGNLGRSAVAALYPPRSLLEASAARVAENESYGVDALESGILPQPVESTVASYALMRACALDQPPGVERLAPAAALHGIDPSNPVYGSSPIAFCGDVWTAVDDQVQGRRPVAFDEMSLQEPTGATAEPPRSRPRLL